MDKNWSHEVSYKYPGITGMIHRSRLKKILSLFRKMDLSMQGKLADFGCSNGYIVSLLKEKIFNNKNWYFYGFDYEDKLLAQAKKRDLGGCEFHNINLNIVDCDKLTDSFDIVTCFETIEHIGSYENAFTSLYKTCKKNGKIIITLPNEKGIPGLAKYFGRKILRKASYSDFFKDSSERDYVFSLMLNKPIGHFRKRQLDCWGEHLGFDWRAFEQFIDKNYLQTNKCRLLSKNNSFLGFNFIYTLEKIK